MISASQDYSSATEVCFLLPQEIAARSSMKTKHAFFATNIGRTLHSVAKGS